MNRRKFFRTALVNSAVGAAAGGTIVGASTETRLDLPEKPPDRKTPRITYPPLKFSGWTLNGAHLRGHYSWGLVYELPSGGVVRIIRNHQFAMLRKLVPYDEPFWDTTEPLGGKLNVERLRAYEIMEREVREAARGVIWRHEGSVKVARIKHLAIEDLNERNPWGIDYAIWDIR